jgi:photosystem II stability/assembly factor-like uncharacterized protein
MKIALGWSGSRKACFGFRLLLVFFISGAVSIFADSAKAKDQSLAGSKKRFAHKTRLKKLKRKKARRVLQQPLTLPRTEEEFEGNAEKRRDWFLSQRMYPFNEFPADARRKAWASRPRNTPGGDFGNNSGSRQNRLLQPPTWRRIGPTPTNSYFFGNWGVTSGRINAVAVSPADPNLILIGSATGGIWRSIDGGANFIAASDNHVDLSVGSIAFASSNPSIVYAGMGDKAGGYLGTGVLKSTDGGQSWTRISNNTLPAPNRISKIEVDPNDPNRVYVAQHYMYASGTTTTLGGFWYSTDGGVNWTQTLSGLARDMVRHPTEPNTLYLAMEQVAGGSGGVSGGVFKSINAGQTWSKVYSAPTNFTFISNIKIAVTPAAPQNLYVLIGGGNSGTRVEISDNEGATWSNRNSTFDAGQLSYNCYLFVHPTDANTIFIGTRDLWRSTDGGTSYTNITNNFSLTGVYNPNQSKAHPDQHHLYISPSNPNLMYLANDGGLWKSSDEANSFQSLNASLSLTMFVSLDLHPTDATRSYGGTQDNGTQRREGNNSWREFAAGDGGQTIVDVIDPSIVYSTNYNHFASRYQNNGDTFSRRIGSSAIFNNDRVAFYPPFVGNGVNSTLYFGTYRLHVSTDRGNTWTMPGGAQDLTRGGTLSAIGVSQSNINVIYTGSSDGRAMRSDDAGVNWTEIRNNLPNRTVTSIAVSKTDSNTAYLTVSGFNSAHVFKTTNAGASWIDISGNLPNIPTNTLLIDPRNPNVIYVGTDIGVFRSTTGGNLWETFNQGMPPVIVSELDALPNGLMQAATYGRGMYEIDLNASVSRKVVADFDGDGKTDFSVFRPDGGNWFISNSSNNQFRAAQFGANGDKIAPGDYDGDGKTDFAVFRHGDWYILNSSDNAFRAVQFGLPADKPVAADYDGDGKTDVAVFRNGVWYSLDSSNNNFRAFQFGAVGDKPVAADYDADGRDDYAVFRSGNWYVQQSSNNQFRAAQWGLSEDKPVAADYDADGKADFAVFRPSNGTWYLLQSEAGFRAEQFGTNGDLPAQGDYDGDGRTDFAVFRAANASWYVRQIASGAFSANQFGISNDIPIPSAHNP